MTLSQLRAAALEACVSLSQLLVLLVDGLPVARPRLSSPPELKYCLLADRLLSGPLPPRFLTISAHSPPAVPCCLEGSPHQKSSHDGQGRAEASSAFPSLDLQLLLVCSLQPTAQ